MTQMVGASNTPSSSGQPGTLWVATALYGVILAGFWLLIERLSLNAQLGHMPSTFSAFALLFAPFWFFGFGLDEHLRRILRSRTARMLAPGALVIPYLVYALPRGEFHWRYLCTFLAIPVSISALFDLLPPGGKHPPVPQLCWQDVLVLAAVGLPIEFSWFRGAFPHNGLDSLPKLLLVDAALHGFLVVRCAEGVGYDFRPRLRDLTIGLRELLFFAPIVISLGIALRFITPHTGLPSGTAALSALLVTFFFIAIPEELFFRGLLQNLLEGRLGQRGALWLSALVFGLSHFNKPRPFNWRYVLLATIAGIFYGRAWRDRRRLLASATTHTLVDVLWSFWFR
jgi:membrane protease YdiL (CAAX protease family)